MSLTSGPPRAPGLCSLAGLATPGTTRLRGEGLAFQVQGSAPRACVHGCVCLLPCTRTLPWRSNCKPVFSGARSTVAASEVSVSLHDARPQATVDLSKRSPWLEGPTGALHLGTVLSLAGQMEEAHGTPFLLQRPLLAHRLSSFKARALGPAGESHAAVLIPHGLLVPSRLRGRGRAFGVVPTAEVLRGPGGVGSHIGRPARALGREPLSGGRSWDPITL